MLIVMERFLSNKGVIVLSYCCNNISGLYHALHSKLLINISEYLGENNHHQ
jgi:hypothetical protein